MKSKKTTLNSSLRICLSSSQLWPLTLQQNTTVVRSPVRSPVTSPVRSPSKMSKQMRQKLLMSSVSITLGKSIFYHYYSISSSSSNYNNVVITVSVKLSWLTLYFVCSHFLHFLLKKAVFIQIWKVNVILITLLCSSVSDILILKQCVKTIYVPMSLL